MGAHHPAAFDILSFDIDHHTGFMPSPPPLASLPLQWDPWEALLSRATTEKLRLGDVPDLSIDESQRSASWRNDVRTLPVLSTSDLKASDRLLRRAHHVLAWIMHFYINTLPPEAPIVIPRSLAIPMLEVSQYLSLPPLLTYSDDVLYNWKFKSDDVAPSTLPTAENITVLTTFSGTPDEEHFYLTSSYIELQGAQALRIMARAASEASTVAATPFASRDPRALLRLATQLRELAGIIDLSRSTLDDVRTSCEPEVFYRQVRPWFKGMDSMSGTRPWSFEGIGERAYEGEFADDAAAARGAKLQHPTPYELNGASAGQSTLIHAFDIFLGIENHVPYRVRGRPAAQENAMGQAQDQAQDQDQAKQKQKMSQHATNNKPGPDSFLLRMQMYMPRQHRAFLKHLAVLSQPLRALVTEKVSPDASSLPTADEAIAPTIDKSDGDVEQHETQAPERQGDPNTELHEAYNAAVNALRAFRDAHLRIVALYIVGPSRRVPSAQAQTEDMPTRKFVEVKGTGGTNAMAFLKHVRNVTVDALLPQ